MTRSALQTSWSEFTWVNQKCLLYTIWMVNDGDKDLISLPLTLSFFKYAELRLWTQRLVDRLDQGLEQVN